MESTKERIIRAATKLFADRGFEDVTIREICRAAKVNGALVNYHFRNKQGLYTACVDRIFRHADGNVIANLWRGVSDAASWRRAFVEWINRFSSAMHTQAGGAAPAAGFFRQEIIHPSAMHGTILREYAIPLRNCLLKLLRMAGLDNREAMEWTASIWAEITAFAIVDPVWIPDFRPAGTDAADWPREFADALCRRTFAILKFHSAS